MTDFNRTHITLLCDRSGSMQFVQAEAEKAVNVLLDEQKAQPGECTLILREFDAGYDYDPKRKEILPGTDWLREMYRGRIVDAATYKLEPRGGTALLDALAETIVATGDYLAAMPEDERPGKVIFVYQTDGQENASLKWSLDEVRALIKHQEDVYSWTFLPLGVGMAAVQQLDFLTHGTASAANMVRSAGTGASVANTYGHTASTLTNMRSATDQASYAVAVASAGASVDVAGNVTVDNDTDEEEN